MTVVSLGDRSTEGGSALAVDQAEEQYGRFEQFAQTPAARRAARATLYGCPRLSDWAPEELCIAVLERIRRRLFGASGPYANFGDEVVRRQFGIYLWRVAHDSMRQIRPPGPPIVPPPRTRDDQGEDATWLETVAPPQEHDSDEAHDCLAEALAVLGASSPQAVSCPLHPRGCPHENPDHCPQWVEDGCPHGTWVARAARLAVCFVLQRVDPEEVGIPLARPRSETDAWWWYIWQAVSDGWIHLEPDGTLPPGMAMRVQRMPRRCTLSLLFDAASAVACFPLMDHVSPALCDEVGDAVDKAVEALAKRNDAVRRRRLRVLQQWMAELPCQNRADPIL